MFVPSRKAIGCSEHLSDMWLSTLGDRRAQQLRSVTATFVFELNYTTFKTRRGQKSKINLFDTRRSAIPVPNNNPQVHQVEFYSRF